LESVFIGVGKAAGIVGSGLAGAVGSREASAGDWAITGLRIVAKTQQMRRALRPWEAIPFIMGK
jgi:hypothetical protein